MSDELLIQVPRDLADVLVAEGFDEVESFRTPDVWATEIHAILSVINAALPATASVATLIIAKSEAARLVSSVWKCLAQRPTSTSTDGTTIELTVRRHGDESRAQVSISSENVEAQLTMLARMLETIGDDGAGGSSAD